MTISTRIDDLANSLSESKMNLDRLSGIIDGWQRSGQGYPDFDFFRAERAEFVYPPWDTAGFRRVSTLVFSSETWETVPFDKIDWNTGVLDYTTVSTGIFRFTRPSNHRVFLVFGHVTWRAEGTSGGPHGVKIVSYPSTQETVMSQVHAESVAQSFSIFYRPPDATTGFDIQVFAEHIPEVSEASFGIWEITRQ